MKTENLIQACDLFDAYQKALRRAHTDSIEAEEGFGELLIFNLLHDSAEIGWQLARAKEAAK